LTIRRTAIASLCALPALLAACGGGGGGPAPVTAQKFESCFQQKANMGSSKPLTASSDSAFSKAAGAAVKSGGAAVETSPEPTGGKFVPTLLAEFVYGSADDATANQGEVKSALDDLSQTGGKYGDAFSMSSQRTENNVTLAYVGGTNGELPAQDAQALADCAGGAG
jgi:hypothetical protein